MKTLFAMAAALMLVGCGPLDENENENVPGQVAQAIDAAPEEIDVKTGPTVRKDLTKSAGLDAIYAPHHRTFESTHLYDTGIKHAVGTVPGSSPHPH